ncbi:hypothetical protein JCM19046_2576 [Bacillus sp. JCM 19046]|nr:hypothetical protein JCM19045_738 [Bacillus sp. JCM 19045]GAF18033.1 hypothetical protein JCM19046_2576 [Bacillus sp. JCM 19046]
MLVNQVIERAIDWIKTVAKEEEGFIGAYLAGSIIQKRLDEPWSNHSDVDIMIVSRNVPSVKIGKFLYKGVLLEASHLAHSAFTSKESILADYHLSYSFAHTCFLFDPSQILEQLQQDVAEAYPRQEWVRKRCARIREKIDGGLTSIPNDRPFQEQVMSWLFPTTVLTHLFLTAALENPTVRRRFEATKKVLASYGMNDVYENLLKEIQVHSLEKRDVQTSLTNLKSTFDLAAQYQQTPIFFASDITQEGRPISIDASQTLIDAGNQREAFFWIVTTYCRCHIILAKDAPQLHEARLPYFMETVKLLGITSKKELDRLAQGTRGRLDWYVEKAEELIERNARILK